ncbi:hypothetical protein CPC08DRAFT_729484 [Agrocybe pediades]|nr:hypothetical protein CPC08DRAFT_729484 [Agrocybe pediades]
MGQPNPRGSWVWVSMGMGVGQIWSTHNPSKPIQMAGCCQGIPITHAPMSDEPMGHGYGYAMGKGVGRADGRGEGTIRNQRVREWAGAPNLGLCTTGPTQATTNSYLGATSAEPLISTALMMTSTMPGLDKTIKHFVF